MRTRSISSLITAAQQREEMVDMAVNVAVGEQPEKMQRRAAFSDPLGQFLPDGGLLPLEECSGRDRPGDQLRALIEDAPRTEGVVADLAIAHIVIRRHPDRLPVGDELSRGCRFGKPVEGRCPRKPDGIRLIATTDPDSVHDADDDRSSHTGEPCVLLECPFTHRSDPSPLSAAPTQARDRAG